MPLPEELAGIGSRLVEWYSRPTGSTDVAPYHVYVYRPNAEWEVRGELGDLAQWLSRSSQAIPSISISLADLLWQAIDESGWTTELFKQERDAQDDPAAQGEVHRAVAELLRRPIPFSRRVIGEIRNQIQELAKENGDDGERPPAVFLYRAGSLFPSFRTSGLLDDLRSELTDIPVTLLYPGDLQGDFGLSFMGKWEPTYNYRALIVDGTGKSS